MGIQPSEAKALTLWEYGALLYGWNSAQDDDIAPPSKEEFRLSQELLKNSAYTAPRKAQ